MLVEHIDSVGFLQIGEGPHWDEKSQSLWFVDIFGHTVHNYTPGDNTHKVFPVGKYPSLILPVQNENNKFVISQERLLNLCEFKDNKFNVVKKLASVDDSKPLNRINDGKCDPLGRVWFGTMQMEGPNGLTPNKGHFYTLFNGSPKHHLDQITCSNGLAWSADMKKMYYIDSGCKTIDAFDCDINTATITNRSTIFTLEKHNIDGFPDGMTIDTNGNLWVAVFGASRVINIDPRKPETLLWDIKLPAEQITSCAFGGANLDELYVTTANVAMAGKLPQGSKNGGLFKIIGLNVKGLPPTEAASAPTPSSTPTSWSATPRTTSPPWRRGSGPVHVSHRGH